MRTFPILKLTNISLLVFGTKKKKNNHILHYINTYPRCFWRSKLSKAGSAGKSSMAYSERPLVRSISASRGQAPEGAAVRGCTLGRPQPGRLRVASAPHLSLFYTPAHPLLPGQPPHCPLSSQAAGKARNRNPAHKEVLGRKRGSTLPRGATPLEKLGGKLTGIAEAQFLGPFGTPCRPAISSFVLWQASLKPQTLRASRATLDSTSIAVHHW